MHFLKEESQYGEIEIQNTFVKFPSLEIPRQSTR